QATTSQFITDLLAPPQGVSYVGLALRFTSGPNQNSPPGIIAAFNPGSGLVTMQSAFPQAPLDTNQFIIQNSVPGTRTRFDANAGTLSSQQDFHAGDTLTFDAGTANPNQARQIISYLAQTHTFVFAGPGFANIPANTDSFVITHTTPTKPEQLADGGQYGIL